MKRSIIIAALIIIAAIFVYAYRDRSGYSPHRLAVFLFQDLNSPAQNAELAAGTQVEISTMLTKIKDLKVINPSTAAGRHLDAARKLGATDFLEGTVERAGDHVAISATLIDVRTGAATWAERYNTPLSDPFYVESNIAAKVAGQVGLLLSPSERKQAEERWTAYEKQLAQKKP
jgi:adenylate cyclase